MEQNTVQKPDCVAITAQARQAAEELLAAAHLRAGDIFVVGCSSSEIVGGHIGKDSSMEAARLCWRVFCRCSKRRASIWRPSAANT